MLRIDALREIHPILKDQLVVTIMGAVAAELYSLGHRPNFFYLEHAMGLASSTGLGLSLSLPNKKVIVLDGDGLMLMNLGSLSTLARYRPRNLTIVIFDNESLLSVGGFPTATSTGTDLEGIVRDAEDRLEEMIGDRESVVFLAPMGAHNAIAVEAWQAVAKGACRRRMRGWCTR